LFKSDVDDRPLAHGYAMKLAGVHGVRGQISQVNSGGPSSSNWSSSKGFQGGKGGKRTCNTNAGQPFPGASGTDRDPQFEYKMTNHCTRFKPERARPDSRDAATERAEWPLVEVGGALIEEPERFHAASDWKGGGCVDQIRDSESVHRAGHRARLTTYRTPSRWAISSNFARLAAKTRPSKRLTLDFFIRTCRLRALVPSPNPGSETNRVGLKKAIRSRKPETTKYRKEQGGRSSGGHRGL
jgi:hypothetical protein